MSTHDDFPTEYFGTADFNLEIEPLLNFVKHSVSYVARMTLKICDDWILIGTGPTREAALDDLDRDIGRNIEDLIHLFNDDPDKPFNRLNYRHLTTVLPVNIPYEQRDDFFCCMCKITGDESPLLRVEGKLYCQVCRADVCCPTGGPWIPRIHVRSYDMPPEKLAEFIAAAEAAMAKNNAAYVMLPEQLDLNLGE